MQGKAGLLATLLMGLALLGGACARPTPTPPPSFNGSAVDPPFPAPDFTLTDIEGRPFHLQGQQGNIVLLYFGYVNCPDYCPITLARLAKVREALGRDADRVRFVFITVDPQRDTPEAMRAYLAKFGGGFIGITGTPEELKPVWKAYGVYSERLTGEQGQGNQQGTGEGNYFMAHSVPVYLVDPQGQMRLVYGFDNTAEEMVQDIRRLLGQ